MFEYSVFNGYVSEIGQSSFELCLDTKRIVINLGGAVR